MQPTPTNIMPLKSGMQPLYRSPMKQTDVDLEKQFSTTNQGSGPPKVNPFTATAAGFSALAPNEFHRAKGLTENNINNQLGANIGESLSSADQGMSDISNSISQASATKGLDITDDDVLRLLKDIEEDNPEQTMAPKSSPMSRLQQNTAQLPQSNIPQAQLSSAAPAQGMQGVGGSNNSIRRLNNQLGGN